MSEFKRPMHLEAPDLRSFLLAAPWVQVLTEIARERVFVDSEERIYGAGEYVARKGQLSLSWIGVMDGLLKANTETASGRAIMILAVPSSSWVGEGSVIKREARRYDLTALRATRVVHLPRATFMWLLETSIEFNRYIIDHLNERTAQFVSMIEVSRIQNPAGRVAGAICGLFNPILYPKQGPLLNISQEEVGTLAGLSRPTTNKALMKLKKLRLVSPEYGGLLVVDLDALRLFFQSSGFEDPGELVREGAEVDRAARKA